MTLAVAIDAVEERLRAFVATADPKSTAREQAERFLSRLSSPVRISLFGRPAVAKAEILNSAVGGQLLPRGAPIPTVELRYGEFPMAQLTRSDGSVTEHISQLTADDLEEVVLVVIERPAPLLRRLSFTDVQADDTELEQRSAIDWAAARTDIALWCSAEYDEMDQRIWSRVPERIQDHAYLVLTGATPEKASLIKAAHMGEFHDVYAISADEPAETNGISALLKRLMSHADMGREADADSALLFLRAQGDIQNAAPAPPKPAAAPQPAAIPEPEPEPELVDGLPPATREAFTTGLTFLRQRGKELVDHVSSGGDADHVANVCSETLIHLSDLISAHDDGASTAVAQLADTVMEAENLVILMENESGEEAAADAVGILLQIRHDFETSLAA
ncbi:MAG: hypothetical protein AAGA87_05990 [Pseudomonadota bacterium]